MLDLDTEERLPFSNSFERDGMQFLTPNVHLFSFSNPHGACKKCEGFGDIIGMNPDLVIPDKSRSVYDDADTWRGTGLRKYYKTLCGQRL